MSRRYEVALGALLHDVGKIAERAGVKVPPAELAALKRDLCPDGGHVHAAYTAWLLARHAATAPLSFAAAHHRPRSPLETLVAVAERHAGTRPAQPHADEDRLPAGEARRRRLAPALARVRREGAVPPREPSHLLLRPLSFRVADLDPAPGDGPSSVDLARDEYLHGLWDAVEAGLAALPTDPRTAVGAALALLERTTSRVPAGPAETEVDLSLHDHARLAAALATVLYVEVLEGHDESDRGLAQALEDRECPRALLVAGEIQGGDALLAGLSERAGPAALSGRSVYLALLADAVAERVLAALDLPVTSLLWLAGTRFLILVPHACATALSTVASEIELALVDVAQGRLSFAWGAVPVALADLSGARLSRRWAELATALETSRERPFGDLLARAHGHEALFAVGPLPRSACPTCGEGIETDDAYCGACTRFEALGDCAARARAFARVRHEGQARAERALRDAGARPSGGVSFEGLGLAYVAVGHVPEAAVDLGDRGILLATSPEERPGVHGSRLGLTPPPRKGGEAPCGTLATVARGARSWGILVVDLDDLGALLERGFPEPERTLARALGLSRAAHHFFAGYAASLAVRDDAVHVVRVGGDGLMAVAPWDRLPGLALVLRDALHRYSGGNAAIGLSAAIALGPEDAPVGAVLAAAASGLRAAKGTVHREGKRKDALAIFGLPVAWEDAALCAEIAHALADVPPSLLGVLLARLGLAATAARPLEPTATLEQVGRTMARRRGAWRLALRLGELAREAGAARAFVERLQRALIDNGWEGRKLQRPLADLLDVSVRWCRLLTRTEDSHERRATPR